MMGIAENHCYQELVRELAEKCRRRDEAVMALLHGRQTEKLRRRAQDMKQLLAGCLADTGFSRCELNARTASVVRCGGYRIENVTIQALEGYWVPLNVYVPEDGADTHPAVLVCVGHWPEGKRHRQNQLLCAGLAQNGFVAAIFDPVSQGERAAFAPREQRECFGDIAPDMLSVNMHMMPGNLAYLLGKDIAALFAWEGMRAVDYLVARGDVDAARIGATGQSGGGTQSLYVAACDARVACCSPIQCISKQALMLENGIGDCEQSMTGISAEAGFDYPDMLWASFPKPVMVSSGRDDSFLLAGVRQVEAEMALLYERAARAEDYEHRVAPCAHELSAPTRQFALDWFAKRLQGRAAKPETDAAVQPDDALRCWPEGFATKTPADIYADMAREYAAQRPTDAAALRTALRRLVPVMHGPCTAEPIYNGDGFTQYLLHTAAHRTAACRLYQKESDRLTVVIAPDGYDVSPLAAQGASVLVITPWAMQTTCAKRRAGYDAETCLFNAAAVLGQCVMVDRVNEVLAAIDHALGLTGAHFVDMLGAEAGGPVALLAACLYERIGRCVLLESQVSWDDMYGRKMYFLPETTIVPGMARVADIPALAALAGDVVFVNPRDYRNEPVAADSRVRCVRSGDAVRAAAEVLAGSVQP